MEQLFRRWIAFALIGFGILVAQSFQATVQAAGSPNILSDEELKYVIKPKVDIKHSQTPDVYYSRASNLAGEQGIITLVIYVNEAGNPTKVNIATTSSYPRLNEAALSYGSSLKFFPGKLAGVDTAMWFTCKVTFRNNTGKSRDLAASPETEQASQELIVKLNDYYRSLDELAAQESPTAADPAAKQDIQPQ